MIRHRNCETQHGLANARDKLTDRQAAAVRTALWRYGQAVPAAVVSRPGTATTWCLPPQDSAAAAMSLSPGGYPLGSAPRAESTFWMIPDEAGHLRSSWRF